MALLLLPLCSFGQEATYGVSAPVVVSGGATYVRNSGGDDPVSSKEQGGLHATVAPSARLGAHWFAYSLVDARSSGYLDYSYDDKNPALEVKLLQAYVGYKHYFKGVSLLIKAGRLASAFGSYPLQYNDAKTALIDPPTSYFEPLAIRPDAYGLVPVTLYGIPGIETQIAWGRIDARAQMTNSSPANPQSLLSSSQAIQWTTGGGYSFHGGLRVGFSQFRGPYLEYAAAQVLPAGKQLHDYAASGIGVDFQWSRASWAAEGEWQRFHVDLPGFIESPSQQAAFVQLKRILSPRLYGAFRTSLEVPGGVADAAGEASSQFAGRQETQEVVLGYWINHLQLLKMGVRYSGWNGWSSEGDAWPSRREFGLELQLVTSFKGFSKSF
jgi:hypothetical protein